MDDEQEDGLCVICLNEISKLITAECGHTICMSCFTMKTSSSSCCAECWEFSQLRTLQVDMAMHPEGEGTCEIHREDQKLFCDRNKTLLCLTCSKSEEHENDIHWPIAVAALSYRKKIQIHTEILRRKLNIVQYLLSKEKEQPLVWAVAWTEHKNANQKIFHKKFHKIWENMMRKKKAKYAEVITWKENKKLMELYQRLKEVEATQEHQIMEEKKEWEAMMSSQSRSLTDTINELEEKMQKPDVEMLQDVAETLERSCVWPNLKPFILKMDVSYVSVVTDFLKLFKGYNLLKRCNFYNLSERKKKAIRIVPDFSGKPYLVYIFGSIQAEDTRGRTFFMQTYPWNKVVAKEDLEPVTTFRNVI